MPRIAGSARRNERDARISRLERDGAAAAGGARRDARRARRRRQCVVGACRGPARARDRGDRAGAGGGAGQCAGRRRSCSRRRDRGQQLGAAGGLENGRCRRHRARVGAGAGAGRRRAGRSRLPCGGDGVAHCRRWQPMLAPHGTSARARQRCSSPMPRPASFSRWRRWPRSRAGTGSCPHRRGAGGRPHRLSTSPRSASI